MFIPKESDDLVLLRLLLRLLRWLGPSCCLLWSVLGTWRVDTVFCSPASERMKTPETREEVHSFHTKRRLLDPPYDPYEAAPRASLARELHFARGVIQADALLVDLHQAHFGLFLGHARAGLHDVVHEPSRVAADLLVSVEDGREQGHAEVAL